ncbi:MAG: xanthine dehydrogenase family protein subunit M [Deltaproteobacteria bacterium]|nr:xanthine dehydrogenase family protein subunit M [Deltaproteobacteria bacterium]
MKPPPFRYHTPRSLSEALDLLRESSGDARVLAGGQSLVPLLNLRLAYPEVLVDLNQVEGLSYIRDDGARLCIGAMTRQREAEFSTVLAERCPLLVEALTQVGHPAIRNRGTVGGSLAHADPVAELPCVMTALDAELVAAGPAGERVMAASEFFLGPYETALAPGEILVEARIPLTPAPRPASFVEFSRRHGDFALAEAAVVLEGNGTCTGARVVAAGPAWTPSRLDAVERLVGGAGVARTDGAAQHDLVEEAGRTAETEVAALVTHADATPYQRRLAAVLVKRSVAQALERWSGS